MRALVRSIVDHACRQLPKEIIDRIMLFAGKYKKSKPKVQKKIKYKNPFKKHKTKYHYFYH